MRPLFIVVAVAVCSCFMLMKGPTFMKIEPIGAAVGIGIGIGIVAALAVLACEALFKKKHDNKATTAAAATTAATASLELGVVENKTTEDESSPSLPDANKKNQEKNQEKNEEKNDEEDNRSTISSTLQERAKEVENASKREGAEKPFVPLLVSTQVFLNMIASLLVYYN